MTLDQLILSAALWCAPEAFKHEIGLVNTCRKEVITCAQLIDKSDKDLEKKTLDCYLNKKI